LPLKNGWYVCRMNPSGISSWSSPYFSGQ
jgi:hypothetical protein